MNVRQTFIAEQPSISRAQGGRQAARAGGWAAGGVDGIHSYLVAFLSLQEIAKAKIQRKK